MIPAFARMTRTGEPPLTKPTKYPGEGRGPVAVSGRL
jgi:hypothetical protein